MKRYSLCLLFVVVLAVASNAFAQTSKQKNSKAKMAQTTKPHVMVTPDDIKWGPAPPSLPPGAQLAVLSGDPSQAGVPFTMRARFPDGYKVPPHWHPSDENVVVLEGALVMSLGEKFDETAGREMTAGSYALMPKGVRHFVWAKGETVIQVYGIGPFAINYVNPADDPRKSAPK